MNYTTEDKYRRSFLESVERLCGPPRDRVMILDTVDVDVLSRIRNGVLFVHSLVSGQSVRALKVLCEVLKTEEFHLLQLYIVDLENLNLGTEFFKGMAVGGYGETFFINKGVVLYSVSKYSSEDRDQLIDACRRLV